MGSFIVKRRQGVALRFLAQAAVRHAAMCEMPNYLTIDGEMVPYAVGAAALNNGSVVLVNGLLVGMLPSSDGF